MSMKKILLAGVAGAFIAGPAAMAGEPVTLTDGQMDDVAAGALNLTFGFSTFGVLPDGTSFTTLNATSNAGSSLNQVATDEQAIIGAGGLFQSLNQTQTASGINASASSATGGLLMFSGGTIAGGGSFSIANFP